MILILLSRHLARNTPIGECVRCFTLDERSCYARLGREGRAGKSGRHLLAAAFAQTSHASDRTGTAPVLRSNPLGSLRLAGSGHACLCGNGAPAARDRYDAACRRSLPGQTSGACGRPTPSGLILIKSALPHAALQYECPSAAHVPSRIRWAVPTYHVSALPCSQATRKEFEPSTEASESLDTCL